MRCLLLLLFTCLLAGAGQAQWTPDPCRTRFSVLTCAPGTELYALFGHTALRVQDSAAGTDWVFNYGAFEFSDPNFYVKFVRGKLPYFLSVENYDQFLAVYRWEQRHVWEQVLAMDCGQKQALVQALQVNLQPQNRYYAYDFFFDNCTTRIRDLINRHAGARTQQLPIVPPGTTFRQQIHSYLNAGRQPWSKLGIDLLLGLPCDAVSSQWQAQFLPVQWMKALAQPASGVGVAPNRVFTAQPAEPSGWNGAPVLAFGLLATVVAVLLYWPAAQAQRAGAALFRLLLFISGLIGCLLLFMWLGTDHQICRQNLNLLWAWPTHLVAAFALRRGAAWVRVYLQLLLWSQGLLALAFFFLPQQLNPAFFPLVLLFAGGAFRLLQLRAYAKNHSASGPAAGL